MASKILLDYVFPISLIPSVPAASTAYLKQVCVVAKPKSGQEGNVGTIYECVSMTEVAARTDNTNAQQLFNAGMTKVYVLLATHLDMATALLNGIGVFYTLLISDDFVDEDVDTEAATLVKGNLTFTAKNTGGPGNLISVEFLDTASAGAEVVTVTGNKISVTMEDGVSTATQLKTAIDAKTEAMALINPVEIASGQGATAQAAFAEDNLEGGSGMAFGTWDGVVGYSSQDATVADTFGTVANQCAFFSNVTNKAKNMFYAFGKLLSAATWSNQQYITMPFNDDIDELGEAEGLFDDKTSFVLNDLEFGNKLGLFCVGGEAIVKPYISKNIRINVQSRALQWIAANQPNYTIKNASLLQKRLQEDVINKLYIETGLITDGIIGVSIVNDNFVATGSINIAKPKALWRISGEMRETL